ncbi:two-component system, NarL family, sensor histidine kinase EvgS [Burkholderiaceae bacterium]|nr:two-component system, NarL family, sensor histidine kinase EvgS [Burkholderiaceae bacterium]
MLPYLSRVSLWLAALAAAASLFTPGQQGAWLASIAMAALIAALVLRRFHLKAQPPPLLDLDHPPLLDDAALLDAARVLSRCIAEAGSLEAAVRDLREELIHELGVHELILHDAGDAAGGRLVVADRFPLGRALQGNEIAGSSEAGFALPVARGGDVIMLLEIKGTEVQVEPEALLRLLALLKVQLDALAARGPLAPAAGDSLPQTQRLDQRELEESQARYTELADTMEDTLFVSNPERSHFDFLASNAFETFGITREQYLERHGAILDHLIEEDRPLLQERRERERRGEPADVTYRIDHPRKGVRWIRSRSRTRVLPDGTLRVYGLVSDVTREREHEVELERARDEAEAASLAKSQFMANMSHEIRTPMNGILGMTELLLGTPLNDRQRRFAKAVYRSGESLLEIINDILDFSKIEAGRLELAPTDFSLRAVVEDTLELLAPRAHEKGLELSFHEASGVPASVHGDPLRLRQILTNLVANAIKFTERGEVVVDLRLADSPVSDEGEAGAGHSQAPGPASAGEADAEGEHGQPIRLRFNVRDTGIGIDADMLPRLFSAFMQANGGMSRRYGGTGLGLAISKQLIELMGGRISVHSAPGVGSQFVVDLPMQPPTGENRVQEFDGVDLSAMRVLVVEDHETNRTVLENMLGAWGMDVTLAEDGQQALDILRGKTVVDPRFDLALVDMRMPRVDGVEFARALKGDGSHPAMKLILLSSVSSPEHVRTAQLAGFDRFVAKPVRKAELRQAVLGVSAQLRDGAPLAPRLQGHVLVVEDNPVNQEVIGQMLRRLGLKVRVAAGALQGLRALCEAHFDLVLMDIQMPGMDGVEALSWFRRNNDGRFNFVTPSDAPVIAVTANALGGDHDRFMALGFDDYLSKPFRQSQLLAMLTKRLSPLSAPTDEAPLPGAAPHSADAAWAGAADSVLDAEALQRLRELDPKGENQLLSRVIKAFESSAGRLLPQLLDAQGTGDMAGVRHVAHTLKSSSASIGAMKLSQLCADMEAKIRTDQLDNLDARVDAMCAELEIVLQALKRLSGPADA